MRELKVNGLNEAITIMVAGEPNHVYDISWNRGRFFIPFQSGPILTESGVNGVSNEVLLAIVEDRLKGFQPACRENALALTHLQECMHWLHHRTNERIQRGVEGTSVK